MTYEQAYSQLYFEPRLILNGVWLDSPHLMYYEPDGRTIANTNINFYPYEKTITRQGHVITLRVVGSQEAPYGDVLSRQFTIIADAPFYAKFQWTFSQVMTHDSADNYDYVPYGSTHTPRYRKGDLTTTYEFAEQGQDLWDACTIPDKVQWNGPCVVSIDWCTNKILREYSGSNPKILRDPSTGIILVDN